MRYLFLCPHCHERHECEHPMSTPPPVTDPCPRDGMPARRVWEAPRLNLGYSPVRHDANQQFLFTQLGKD